MKLDPNDIKIRQAVSTDLTRLTGMDHTSQSDYVWQLDVKKADGQVSATLRDIRLPRTVNIAYPRDIFSLPETWNRGSLTLVATLGGVPIGYTRIREQVTAESVWVLDLVVETEARRSGVASAMLQAVGTWATGRGHRQLFVEMSTKSHPAIRLVQKLGFEFCGYNDHYYGSQDVALFFGRRLK